MDDKTVSSRSEMNFRLLIYSFVLATALTSCKTEYERVRTSNDPNLILEKANAYYDQKDYYKAQNLYDIVIPFYRGKKEAEVLFYKYAYCNYHQDQFLLSQHYFENYANTFFTSPYKEEAQYMAAYSQYQLSPNHRLDQTYTETAITAFQKFINLYPDSERSSVATTLIDEMRAKLEKKAFEQGRLYYDIKNYKAAINSLETMIKDFPETKRGEEIKWIILDSSHVLADNSVFIKKEARFNETLSKASKFIEKYPSSKYLSEVEKIKSNCISSLKEIQNVGLEN